MSDDVDIQAIITTAVTLAVTEVDKAVGHRLDTFTAQLGALDRDRENGDNTLRTLLDFQAVRPLAELTSRHDALAVAVARNTDRTAAVKADLDGVAAALRTQIMDAVTDVVQQVAADAARERATLREQVESIGGTDPDHPGRLTRLERRAERLVWTVAGGAAVGGVAGGLSLSAILQAFSSTAG